MECERSGNGMLVKLADVPDYNINMNKFGKYKIYRHFLNSTVYTTMSPFGPFSSAICKGSVSSFFLFKILSVVNGVVPSWMVDWYLSSRTGCHKFWR